MKRILSTLLLLLSIGYSFAQYKLEVESFSIDTGDINSRTTQVNDLSGDPTALLKIQIPMVQDAVIESPLKVKDGGYKPGEFRVYLGHGSKRVTFKHQDFEPLVYYFDEPLEGKNSYILVLKLPENYMSKGQISARISTNVNKADLNINGEKYHTDNGDVIVRLKAGEYPFTITPSIAGFHPYEGTLTITADDVKNEGRVDRYYELASDKKANLHINAHPDSEIFLDGKKVTDWKKKAITLPLGRHTAEVRLGEFNKDYKLNLREGENTLNADIRTVLVVRSPVNGEFSISPIGNALKPTQSKIKAGQPVKLLGTYKLEAKNKGYDSKIENLTFNPVTDSVFLSVPMISNARKLYTGYSNSKVDRKKGEKEFRKLISDGDDVAMWEFGCILASEDNSVRQSQGLGFIRRAAANGNPEACMSMSQYVNDPAERRNYLVNAIKGGAAMAHNLLGHSYLHDNPISLDKAFAEFSKSSDSYSKIGRAEVVIAGEGKFETDTDIHGLLETIEPYDKYFHKSLALRGSLYAKGIGVAKDVKKAAQFWQEAGIENLDNNSLLIMAIVNSENPANACAYLRNVDLSAFNSDPVIYDGWSLTKLLRNVGQGIGNDKSYYFDSFKFFNKAYILGDRSKNTLLFLGKFYKDGHGTEKDPSKAKALLQLVASQHQDKNALRWLGNIYENEKKINEAKTYYLQAIKLGDNDSKGYYGAILVNEKDRVNGVKYLTEAANGGHKQSMRNLIKYYEKIEPNATKAKQWKNKLEAK